MWLVTDRGFYSAVEDRFDPGVIVVRARVRADLTRLKELIPGLQIVGNHGTDYRYRAYVSREAWTVAVAQLAEEIDYGNFKDAVTARQGYKRHDVYMRVWSVLHTLQPSRRNRRQPRIDWDRFDRLRADHG